MAIVSQVGRFASSALDARNVQVVLIDGEERIGQLYQFRVRFRHTSGPLTEAQLTDLLLKPCAFALGPGDDDVVKGIVREVEIHTAREGRAPLYDVVVVPTVWLLTVSKLSRIYQGMSVKEMAADVLARYSLGGEHFDLRIGASAKREFSVQYHESDWDYLQRWFEHEGYFYWFEHSASGETLVVADTNQATKAIPGAPTIPYRELAGLVRNEDSVFEWGSVQKRIPARVVLKDYNDQKPLLPMVGRAEVGAKVGFGVFFEYGDNFDSPAAGDELAKKRAERLLTEQRTLFGVTDCTRFHVGHSFTLVDHYDQAQNGDYLITAIAHHLGPVASPDGDELREVAGYRASFEAIPLKVQYRPERTTPWPSIHGLMHGHVDSESSGKFSTLDAQGRYRVRFPFDASSKTGEGSSMWVRMAQPYSGSGYGSHHPLHRGTEVLIAFYDGDPDRPVIVGTVPNAVTPGPSVAANATQSVTKTASGIQITLDDSLSKS